MASTMSMKEVEGQRPPTAGSTMNEPLRIPKTPLESRQGYHPKSVSTPRLYVAPPPS